jgi:hypothetical protein
MKDLGYKRTPTDAMYQVEMPDGSLWQVPVQAISDSRDENYAEDKEDTIGSIREGGLSEYEITDWAGNNMNWSDVKQYAVEVPRPKRKVNWEEGWSNGEKEIVGKV